MQNTALAGSSTIASLLLRVLAWAIVFVTFAFLINNYLTYWLEWPGLASLMDGEFSVLSLIQLSLYFLALIIPIIYVQRGQNVPLRTDAAYMNAIVAYIIRASFWIVLLIGVADFAVSFMRVEGGLSAIIGERLAGEFNFSRVRAPYLHLPLALLALIIAAFTRSLGFPWLALLVVVAELIIVISRFVFSYEQAFMGDLVRFWYGALFLFASAYTLLEDGHVRVDVFYAGFSVRKKGLINTICSLFIGVVFCWTILYLGMSSKSAIINAPLIGLEVSQSGFGMFVKYIMAGFLAIFATSMLVQFTSYILESAADYRGDPGGKLNEAEAPQAF